MPIRAMCAVFLVFVCINSVIAEPITCVGHTGVVNSVRFSPDSKTVVSCGIDRLARAWNVADGKQFAELPIYDSSEKHPLAVGIAFSPDGHTVAVGARGVPVTFWDTTTWKKETTSLPVDQIAYGVSYSPDGSRLAYGEPQEVKVWDLHAMQLDLRLHVNVDSTGMPTKLAFSPNGSLLAAAAVVAWQMPDGNEAFKLPKTPALSLAFSPDGKFIATAGDYETKGIWDIWNLKDKKKTLSHLDTQQQIFRCIAYRPDGKMIATGGGTYGFVELWDAETGKLITKLEGHSDQVADVCFSPDGQMLASAGYDKLVLIWKLETDVIKPDVM